ncbi:DUF2927 domain-containing protein [Cereibacter azotoformans]|uniref:DUF2927 domain-containing protein n=1 Tax=Cereibacter azotoformans TaxID=43057 RepID=UPI001EEA37CB|nr:DUF2927 domain-containing protein [Cereibacter azotoformans]ULB09438.1 DUF2927 domain-containing protein [Cereibacter azotoformans]
MRRLLLAAGLVLSACGAVPEAEVAMHRPHWLVIDPLPDMKMFAGSAASRPLRPNAELARDFLELTFQMESGRVIERMSRFEAPITVSMTGLVPPSAPGDLTRLLARLRDEARIDIRETGAPAMVAIEFIERRRMQALVPTAACFVVPRVTSFEDYRRVRRKAQVDWASLETREQVAIFIPADTSPQEVRDCLHEELAQAIGPLNDLYRLSDSVFNDDNFHTVLTGFDMLMLRVTYAPEMRSGMTRDEAAAALPKVLARLNPKGGRLTEPAADDPTPRAWIAAIEEALGPTGSDRKRRTAALRALALAADAGWRDARMAFSLFGVARLGMADEMEISVAAFVEAARIYRSLPGGAIHAAHIDMQMAALALSSGEAADAILLCDRAIPIVRRAENAALLATLLMIRSEALRLEGRAAEARASRLDSLAWARYGFGDEAEVRTRMSEIAALTPGRLALAPTDGGDSE